MHQLFKRVLFFVIASIFFLQNDLSAKVRILTFHCNKPNFIELQYKTLKKFLKEDFELIVFNDAYRPKDETAIEEMCQKYGIQCIRFEPQWHMTDPLNDYLKTRLEDPAVHSHIQFGSPLTLEKIYSQPSVRHCHVIQYALDNFGYNHNDIVAIMDGDAFFIRPSSLREMLRYYAITGIQMLHSTENVDFLWVVFVTLTHVN